ncbi:retrotransposable element ORF2 protein, partial [Plecturocebus cupreus]
MAKGIPHGPMCGSWPLLVIQRQAGSGMDLQQTPADLQQRVLTVKRKTNKQKEIVSTSTKRTSTQRPHPKVTDFKDQRDHNSLPAREQNWMANEFDELTEAGFRRVGEASGNLQSWQEGKQRRSSSHGGKNGKNKSRLSTYLILPGCGTRIQDPPNEIGSCYVDQADLELLASSNLPNSASQNAGPEMPSKSQALKSGALKACLMLYPPLDVLIATQSFCGGNTEVHRDLYKPCTPEQTGASTIDPVEDKVVVPGSSKITIAPTPFAKHPDGMSITYAAIKNDEFVSFVGTWMNLETIILSKLTQEHKIKHRMFSLIGGFSLLLPRLEYNGTILACPNLPLLG